MSFKKTASAVSVLTALLALPFVTTAEANHELPRSERGGQHTAYYRSVFPYISVAASFGGDEIGRFEDSFGDIEKVTGGGGGHITGGFLFAFDPWTSARLTAGYQADSVSRLNGESSLDRVSFEITALKSYRFHEFGAGLVMHTGIQYDCNINSVCAGDVAFDPAVGYAFEYAYRFGGYRGGSYPSATGLRLGVRYTAIEYNPEVGSASVDGSSLAGFIGLAF